jgi:hypothetical protein
MENASESDSSGVNDRQPMRFVKPSDAAGLGLDLVLLDVTIPGLSGLNALPGLGDGMVAL